jgi:hypothetical protein
MVNRIFGDGDPLKKMKRDIQAAKAAKEHADEELTEEQIEGMKQDQEAVDEGRLIRMFPNLLPKVYITDEIKGWMAADADTHTESVAEHSLEIMVSISAIVEKLLSQGVKSDGFILSHKAGFVLIEPSYGGGLVISMPPEEILTDIKAKVKKMTEQGKDFETGMSIDMLFGPDGEFRESNLTDDDDDN